MFIGEKLLLGGMSEVHSAEETESLEEFTEDLAEATGVTPKDIKRNAQALDIAPASEAEVVDE